MGSRKQQTETTQTQDTTQYGKQTRTPFTSDQMKQAYNDYLGTAQNNYQNVLNSTNKLNGMLDQYMQNGSIGDTSYFKQAWDQAQGIDQSNLKKMNSADLNPYNDEVTRNYVDASNKAAYLANGQNVNQMMGNMIRSGMANGSGHQTAAAKVGAQLAANINAQNQATYMARQNQLEENALRANNQLGSFYSTLANIGIDYARLNQQDLNTLLSAYNNIYSAQNNALGQLGQAVQMGSDPTETQEMRQHTVGNTVTTSSAKPAFGDYLGGIVGLGTGFLRR